MRTNLQDSIRNPVSGDFTLPENLTSLMPAGELVQRTLEAVNMFFWAGATGETTFLARTFNPRVMLTVLTYSYATGIFSAAAIAQACERDETFHYLSLGVRFTADRICIFRGQNSELLKRCLAFVIRHADPHSALNGDPTLSDNVNPVVNNFWNQARSQREAERRIDYAIHLDLNG